MTFSVLGEALDMDGFLKQHGAGQGEPGYFTLNPARSREKLLASRPKVEVSTILRLLDAAVFEWGYEPGEVGCYHDDPRVLELKLPGLGRTRLQDLLVELAQPFGSRPGATTLARALLLEAKKGGTIRAFWSDSRIRSLLSADFELHEKSLDVPSDLGSCDGDLRLAFSNFCDRAEFQRYRASLFGGCHAALHRPEVLKPLKSASLVTEGFFDYRTRPFTAIRAYVAQTESKDDGLQLDLCDGPYTMLGQQTAVLDRQEGRRVLFIAVRPDYGTPTLLHHSIDTPLRFGWQTCRATFWVASSDRPARVHFFSPPMLSDPVPVSAPAGLDGIVYWPGLSFDLWGSQLVKNKEFEQALAWTQERVTQTATALATNLDHVLARLREGNLIKGASYVDEVAQRVRQLWGQPAS